MTLSIQHRTSKHTALKPDPDHSALLARIVSGRPLVNDIDPKAFLSASLKDLDHPRTLFDIDKACERIAQAFEKGEQIATVTDYDVDGITSLAILKRSLSGLMMLPSKQITHVIGDRLKEGYGLSEGVCQRLLKLKPKIKLVITADCGSSDEKRIAVLKDNGIDVIVTDHHLFPQEGPPQSAYAVVSPIHPLGHYPDQSISGGVVVWLLMNMLSHEMVKQKLLAKHDSLFLMGLLDYCCLSTIADCVSLGSKNNRAIVKRGLSLISSGSRPAWRVFKQSINKQKVSASDIGFTLGPIINADGRLSTAFNAARFLLSNKENKSLFTDLVAQNEERKTIERALTDQAIVLAKQQIEREPNRKSIVVYLVDGHPGIVGITASRLKEYFGKPSVVFCPSAKEAGVISGSARSIDYFNFHIKDALQVVNERHPNLFMGMGGHKGAAGMSLEYARLATFDQSFEDACLLQFKDVVPVKTVISDGDLNGYNIDLNLVKALNSLGPFGRGFEQPLFEIEVFLLDIKIIGKTKTHLKLSLRKKDQQAPINAVWFGVIDKEGEPLPVKVGETVTFLAKVEINEWLGKESVQLIVSEKV